MSKPSHTESSLWIACSRLLLIDYGLSEKTVQAICHGLDQLFSIVTAYVGLQRISSFGLIVNGQNHSETFIPLSLAHNIHMDLQVALCKLQLLAQKWSTKFNKSNVLSSSSSASWQSAFRLVNNEINAARVTTSSSADRRFCIVVLTNRLTESILVNILEFLKNYNCEDTRIELVCVNDNSNTEPFEQNIQLLDSVRIKNIFENKYSVGLYFKSWLSKQDHESEHLQLLIPTMEKTDSVDYHCHMIRCDLEDVLIDPHHHLNHDRFLIYTEPTKMEASTSQSLPIYKLKALNFIKQAKYCMSMVFGMPLFIVPSLCYKYDVETITKNEIAFHTLIEYLRAKELMLICCLNDYPSSFSGHFILSAASEHALILRSIASSELLLPLPNIWHKATESKQKECDKNLFKSLSIISIEDEEYNPLYYEARKSKIILNKNLL